MHYITNLFFFIVPIILMLLCGQNTVYLYAPDKSQCITVITKGETRYVIDGKHTVVPDTNYVKLKMDYWGADCFQLCWENNGYDWEGVIEKAQILECKLDTTRFSFSTKLPEDASGIPTEAKFRQKNCGVFIFDMDSLSPDNGGAIIEHKKKLGILPL